MIAIPKVEAANSYTQIAKNLPCLGVVLAGGKSSRMGEDKALLQRNNQTMLQYSTSLLTQAGVSEVVISGQHGLTDEIAEQGPVGGIYSIIKKYQPQSLLILPVDLPLMNKQTLAALKTAGELSQQACCYQEHFLPLYLPNNAFVTQFLANRFVEFTAQKTHESNNKSSGKSGPSIRALLKQVPHQTLTLTASECLFNSNTPQDWQQAKQKFKQPISFRKNYV